MATFISLIIMNSDVKWHNQIVGLFYTCK